MIRLELRESLGNRSLYWLAKETGIAYSTIHKLATTTTQSVNFVVLDKLCKALECSPGDLLIRTSESKNSGK